VFYRWKRLILPTRRVAADATVAIQARIQTWRSQGWFDSY
jgi:hypothetical protein